VARFIKNPRQKAKNHKNKKRDTLPNSTTKNSQMKPKHFLKTTNTHVTSVTYKRKSIHKVYSLQGDFSEGKRPQHGRDRTSAKAA
jgi:hypothetical protein